MERIHDIAVSAYVVKFWIPNPHSSAGRFWLKSFKLFQPRTKFRSKQLVCSYELLKFCYSDNITLNPFMYIRPSNLADNDTKVLKAVIIDNRNELLRAPG